VKIFIMLKDRVMFVGFLVLIFFAGFMFGISHSENKLKSRQQKEVSSLLIDLNDALEIGRTRKLESDSLEKELNDLENKHEKIKNNNSYNISGCDDFIKLYYDSYKR